MKQKIDSKKINELLTRGVEEVIEKTHLEKVLRSGKKLRVKFGIDPTGPILHLGHSVPLRLLRRFQDLGHTVIFLVGDFTAQIGDPTGRSESRPPLAESEIKKNMESYSDQASLILDMSKVEVRYNTEWYNKMSLFDLHELASKVTYGQVSARRDFKERLKKDEDFTFAEFMYPVLQGYDSVALRSDVEVGGTDQKFNMLMGRRIQRRYDQEEQDVVTVKLLEGLDGAKKMGKSQNNYISLTEKPEAMFGKIMSIPDALIAPYFIFCTDVSIEEVAKIKTAIKKGKNPRDFKAQLAETIVSMYHSKSEAKKAAENFDNVFKKHEAPENIKTIKLKKERWNVVDLLLETKLASSKSEARRLIEQDGVKMDGDVLKNNETEIVVLKKGCILQRGKKQFVRLVI